MMKFLVLLFAMLSMMATGVACRKNLDYTYIKPSVDIEQIRIDNCSVALTQVHRARQDLLNLCENRICQMEVNNLFQLVKPDFCTKTQFSWSPMNSMQTETVEIMLD